MKKFVSLIFALAIISMTNNAFAQDPQTQKAEKPKKEATAKEKKVKEEKVKEENENHEADSKGNAYGKEKGSASGKDFGQNRSTTSMQKSKKK
ncbi:MAG TPA: hypothetical protein VK213_10470 [Bacteroidales bacterium]|nr:hypothetical protein [Bacteroidales bacterium]